MENPYSELYFQYLNIFLIRIFMFGIKNIATKLNCVNRRKFIQTLLSISLFLFFVSWTYKLLCLFALVFIWKDFIDSKLSSKYAFTAISVILSLCIFFTLPRYRLHSSDRVQLIYQDEGNNPVHPPFLHYLLNVLFPEEEIMNFCVWGAKLGIRNFPFVGNGNILKQFKMDCNEGKLQCFYNPHKQLNEDFLFLMSGTTSQIFNMIGFSNTKSVYLIKPKNFNPRKKYPVVFFCHGGLGNWKLYQGIMKDLQNCIVLSVGTMDWSGIYNTRDVEDMISSQLYFLKKLGFAVDKSNLHIIGLSNGGTAANIAYSKFSRSFKSITFLSTGIYHMNPITSKVILIGGGKDKSSLTLPYAFQKLNYQGCNVSLYWDKNETHFILVNKRNKVIEYLNREILNKKLDNRRSSRK